MSATRFLTTAQNAARAIPGILSENGLDPLINRYVLTETERGDTWLFVVLDDSASEFLESYAGNAILSQLATALNGHHVLFSNSFGLRYAVLLNSPNLTERFD